MQGIGLMRRIPLRLLKAKRTNRSRLATVSLRRGGKLKSPGTKENITTPQVAKSQTRGSHVYGSYSTWGAESALAAVHLGDALLDQVQPLAHRAHALHGGNMAPIHGALKNRWNEEKKRVRASLCSQSTDAQTKVGKTLLL